MNQTSTVQKTFVDVESEVKPLFLPINAPMDPPKTVDEFGFNTVDPIEPYPIEKINIGPGNLPSCLHARRIPLFKYLFMLHPNKTHKKYGWGDNI